VYRTLREPCVGISSGHVAGSSHPGTDCPRSFTNASSTQFLPEESGTTSVNNSDGYPFGTTEVKRNTNTTHTRLSDGQLNENLGNLAVLVTLQANRVAVHVSAQFNLTCGAA